MVLVGSSKVRVCQDRTSRRGCGTKDCPSRLMVLVGSSKVRVCQDRTSRRGCGTKDCPCPVLSCPSAPALTSSSKSSWGWVGGPFPTRALRGQTIPPSRLWRAPHEPCGGGARWGMASAPPSWLRLHETCTWGGVFVPPLRAVSLVSRYAPNARILPPLGML